MESPGLQPRRARPADERAPLIFHADSTVNDSIQRLLSPDFVEKRDVRLAGFRRQRGPGGSGGCETGRGGEQFGQFAQVLGGGGEEELIVGAAGTSQS